MLSNSTDVIFDKIMKLHPKIIDLKLDRVLRLLKKLGNPEKKLPPVIHIAGTNGKGSIQAIIKAGLEADGKIVHAYTSPHLSRFNERIYVAGKSISDDNLNEILDECYKSNSGTQITYFEITTVAAILAFSRSNADYCILEVGLGGRFDATNIIDKPEVCIITPISLDHQTFLGSTIKEIAFEKAGILKSFSPCFVANQKPEALEVIRNVANTVGSTLKIYKEGWNIKEKGDSFYFEDSRGGINLPLPSLIGSHQVSNAGISVAVLRHLGVSSKNVLKNAMLDIVWPARMQRLVSGPVIDIAKNSEIWLDGGHNPAAGQVLSDTLRSLPPMKTYLICGMLNTKDISGYINNLKNVVDELIAISVPNEVSTFTALETSIIAKKLGIKSSKAQSLEDAASVVALYPKPSRIVICGSLYLAGFVLRKHA